MAQQEAADENDERPACQDPPSGPSADFSALIDTIVAEGRAYRAEEQREDRGKRLREWLTVIMLGATMVGVFWQVREMIHVYGPVRDQAIASQKAAEAATVAAAAATKQSENSDKALVQAQRAWVGPRNASIAADPAIGKPVEITIEYQNSGREPATGFFYFVEPFGMLPAEEADGTLAVKIHSYMKACQDTKEWPGGSVVYPSSSGFGGGYTLSIKTTDNFIEEAMINGEKTIIVQGCFVYKTLEAPKHSYFCYFYRQGFTKIQNLNICLAGHDAN
jgi:hypothetical protein